MSRRGMTSAAVALLLALTPATAFAGGAGDEQYQDPLAAPTAPKKPKKKVTTAPTTTTTPSSATAPAAASAPATTSPAQSTSSASGQLPRTGAPAGLIGLGGAALIASGVAVRRRTTAQ